MRLTAAFLGAPSSLTPEGRTEALKYFSPEEIVGLLLKLTSYLVNKPRAALGIDGALVPGQLTTVGFGGVDEGEPESEEPTPD